LPRDPVYARRRWGDELRTLYRAQKNVEAYLALAQEMGLTPADCHALATMLVARWKAEDALIWVERGITLARQAPHSSMAGYELSKLKRLLLAKLGRGDEALDAAWAEYREHPDKYAYADLMQYVPKAGRAAWHQKAMEATTDSDLASLIELLLETKELERLADLVGRTGNNALENLSHYSTEPAAKKLARIRPDIAARLWCAQGMRIVNAKKSKYYDAALSNFERGRRCFERAGLINQWQRIVKKVRFDRHRKGGFLAGFEEIVGGSGPSRRPSFLQQAKGALDLILSPQLIEIPAAKSGVARKSRSFPSSALPILPWRPRVQSVCRVRPTVIIVFGLIVEPRFDRLRARWWRRVADPGRKFRDALRPLIEGSLEPPRQSTKVVARVPLRHPTLGIVPSARNANRLESGDRQCLQRNDAIGFAVRLHLDIPVPAEDGHDAPRLLLHVGEGCISRFQDRSSPRAEHVRLRHGRRRTIGQTRAKREVYPRPPALCSDRSFPPANEFREEVFFASVRASRVDRAPLEADLG
jgi:hypothetical protein